jgi:hypothetical protein
VVGLAVLVIAIIALRNPKHTSTNAGSYTRTVTPSASAPTAPASTPKTQSRAPSSASAHSTTPTSGSSSTSAIGSLPLIVLNDTHTPHLARDAAQRFQGGGWSVTSYDENYSNDIASTVAYYDPSVAGAKRAAEALQKQYPTIKRVVPRFAQLPAGPIVVVLTTDYSAG